MQEEQTASILRVVPATETWEDWENPRLQNWSGNSKARIFCSPHLYRKEFESENPQLHLFPSPKFKEYFLSLHCIAVQKKTASKMN